MESSKSFISCFNDFDVMSWETAKEETNNLALRLAENQAMNENVLYSKWSLNQQYMVIELLYNAVLCAGNSEDVEIKHWDLNSYHLNLRTASQIVFIWAIPGEI